MLVHTSQHANMKLLAIAAWLVDHRHERGSAQAPLAPGRDRRSLSRLLRVEARPWLLGLPACRNPHHSAERTPPIGRVTGVDVVFE